jgi:hypothetical protein
MEQFQAAVELVCLLPRNITYNDLDPRFTSGTWHQKDDRKTVDQHKALIDYARAELRKDIENFAQKLKGKRKDASTKLYLKAHADVPDDITIHGGDYFWFNLIEKRIFEEKSENSIYWEYRRRPKTEHLRNLPGGMRDEYQYYRQTLTAFAKTAMEVLNQRIQEVQSVANLTEEDGLNALKAGDGTVEIRRNQRFPELAQK